jgi:ATP phosphoribosyltransferase regulatory subunit
MPDRKLEAFFRHARCTTPDIGLLQPADPILNAAGEDLRRRIFMTADEGGQAWCLRPEFTIPVCLRHIEGGKAKQRYGYVGKVFRHRTDEPHEFVQAGIEDIGAKNMIAADTRSLSDCVTMLRELGAGKLAVTTGDQAIFEAVLESLGLPDSWQTRLGRAFGDPVKLKADLDRLSGDNGSGFESLDTELRKRLEAGDREGVEQWIAGKMEADGISPASGRTPQGIATRLFAKAELASAHLTAAQRRVLEEFLALDVPLAEAEMQLWGLARKYRIVLGAPIETFHKRVASIGKLELKNVQLRYRAAFGRRLDYYTGFVFEVADAAITDAKPLAGGGRYDGLLDVLGASETTPAVGFSVWVDRLTTKPRKHKSKAKKKAAARGAKRK